MVSLGMSFGSININFVLGCVETVINVKVFQGKTVSSSRLNLSALALQVQDTIHV